MHCEHELSLAQMKISVAHRNYGLKWFNAAAAAASATPIRPGTVHCVVFQFVLGLCAMPGNYLCSRTSHGVAVAANVCECVCVTTQ